MGEGEGGGGREQDVEKFGFANLAIFEVDFHAINAKLFGLFGFPLLIAFGVQFAASI